ncbi:MAG: hypothetical protein RLP44_29640 [Aggregatilineales bacterium]
MQSQSVKIMAVVMISIYGFFLSEYTLTRSNAQETKDAVGDCILIIGDSVAHGSAVFEVPGQGFPIIQTQPFAEFVDTALHDIGAYHLGVYDLSVEASSLTGTLPYTTTPEFRFAQTQNCQYIVILPWMNELRGMVNENFALPFTALLADFISSIRQENDTSQIVMMNYYPTATSELGDRIYESSISTTTIQQANTALATACAPAGVLGEIDNLACMDIAPLYSRNEHVFTSIDRTTYFENQYSVLRGEGSELLEIYWRENPNGLIYGDGVHLNEIGKRIMAEALMQELLSLDISFGRFEINN